VRENTGRLFAHVLGAAAVVLGLLAASPSVPAATPLQPGMYISTPVGSCTMGFVLDSPTTVYMATAAHCVSQVGDRVSTIDGTSIGRAALIGSADGPSTDWALIAIDSAYASRVKGSVIGHPTMPTGFNTQSNFGDEVLYSGYGIPWEVAPATRTDRFGYMVSQDKSTYELIGSDTWGDSGGPIMLAKSGQAMGLVSRFCFGACTSEGPTVQGIIAQAAAKGVALKLRTVAP
jgi:hypothetical protein